jgi:alpha-galactosidase
MEKMKLFMVLAVSLALSGSVMAKPVKVFIMAGQSNMEGHAKVETFDYIGDDPATAPLLKKMRSPDGTPKVCDHVWISYLTGPYDGSANGVGVGKLTAGYGSRGSSPQKDGGKIGSEFTFGLRMDEKLDQPVVIIKTAWGGRDLNTNFRPPSAGPYQLNAFQEKKYETRFKDPAKRAKWMEEKQQATGVFYRMMIEHVQKTLKDLKQVYPDYKDGQGYEVAGFVWLQGFNDFVDKNTYPDVGKPGRFNEYSSLLSCFIRDVRKDLDAPGMPFVIGVMGIGGESDPAKPDVDQADFRRAMAAPADLPEFKGNVVAVQTAPFWDAKLNAICEKRDKIKGRKKGLAVQVEARKITQEEADRRLSEFRKTVVITPEENALWNRGASNAGYHYLGCSKTFALMGEAFADAILNIRK